MIKRIFYFILMFGIFNCCTEDEKINIIPLEFQGVWVLDEEADHFMVITSDSVYQYWETEEKIIEIEKNKYDTIIKYGDTSITNIFEINKVDRSSCNDCTYYGINIKTKDVLYTHIYLYLNKFNSFSNKFVVLEEHLQINNPYNDSREWRPQQNWKRIK